MDYSPHNTPDCDCPGCAITDVIDTVFDRMIPADERSICLAVEGMIDSTAAAVAENHVPRFEQELRAGLHKRLDAALDYFIAALAAEQGEEATVQ